MFVEIQNGRIVGYITSRELAKKLNVSIEAIRVWVSRGKLESLKVGNELWFKEDTKYPKRRNRVSQ